MEDLLVILKMAGFAIAISLVVMIVKKAGRDNEATLISIAGLVVVMIWLITYLGTLFTAVQTSLFF